MTGEAVLMAPGRRAWASEARAILSLGWPIILTNLAQMAITTTDVVMMGWLGPAELAAGTLGANLFHVFFLVGMGLALAATPLMAQAVGARRRVLGEVRRTVGQGFVLCILYFVPTAALLWHTQSLLVLLGQDPALASIAEGYVRALMWSVLPALLFVILRGFLATMERPRAAMVVTVAAIFLNAFTNWVLMFGNLGAPALGVVGAGISSTIAHAFMALALLAYCAWDRTFRRYRLTWAFLRPDPGRLWELLRVGFPIGLALGFEMGVFSAAAMLMGWLGAVPLAAHAIALQVASFTFMVPMGISTAATVRVGLAAGRGDLAGVGRAGWTALALGVGFMATMAALLIAFPLPIVDAFLDLDDPANRPVVPLAVSFLAIAGLFQVFDGGQVIGSAALRGLKDTRVPMVLAAVGYWAVGMPLAWALAFPAGLEGLGIWIGLALGLASVSSLMVLRWSRREALGLVGQASAPSSRTQPAMRQEPSAMGSMK